MAATPLNDNKSFITASVLWIPNLLALQHFNDFLLKLGENMNNEWQGYLNWLRPYGCCKQGGVDPDVNGKGIKPYAINEMSMLGYYHYLYPKKFLLLPIVPRYDYYLHKLWSNLTAFSPIGHEIAAPTGVGIWDPNSWGQYMGGTSSRPGFDLQFTDRSHVAGQAIRTNKCIPFQICSNISISFPIGIDSDQSLIGFKNDVKNNNPNFNNDSISRNNSNYCYTAPYVRCGEDQFWTPLWNLHVHSKRTSSFKSEKCDCPSI